ncbi:antibiotic biosynthesis monooxygenase [Acrocarpospora corrugata]|uniref:Antibiotic biosynthesis monooxygenase n=1 Tax=Acrocarpospora corrugata TaxID=35763 RepID=A0A5M3W1T3_9ACTN|nr:putative quinol monooxygenase [Acrocarpospora corrugata]GES02676.1 antibiotic biosynthesis monooxygenase [Acrocarpospora corrugata]
MIIVAGKLYVDPGAREAYLAGCQLLVEEARRTPGCLDFAMAADALEPGRINVFERWDSDEALEKFRGDGPDPGQLAEIRGAEVARYRISAVEDA